MVQIEKFVGNFSNLRMESDVISQFIFLAFLVRSIKYALLIKTQISNFKIQCNSSRF